MREIKKSLGRVTELVKSYTESQNSCLGDPEASLASVILCLSSPFRNLYSILLPELIFASCKYFNQKSNINTYLKSSKTVFLPSISMVTEVTKSIVMGLLFGLSTVPMSSLSVQTLWQECNFIIYIFIRLSSHGIHRTYVILSWDCGYNNTARGTLILHENATGYLKHKWVWVLDFF